MGRVEGEVESRMATARRASLGRLAGSTALALVAAACSGTGTTGDAPAPASEAAAAVADATAIESGRPFDVETETLTFVDDSRPTDDPEDRHDAPSRTLETTVYVPQGDGPFPLVVQAHGFGGHPAKYTELAGAWASAGYVVALPTFPLTNEAVGDDGVVGDYVNQPADISFVIDRLLALSAGGDPVLGGSIDADRIGVSGHSLGGATVYGLAFNDCCRDDRLDAVVLMSTLALPFDGGSFDFTGVPLLMLQLTDDPVVPYDAATGTYAQASSPRFLVTLEGGVHAEPYEDAPSPHDAVVIETTTAFWDAYLLDDPDGADRLVEAAGSADLTSVTADP